MPRARAQVLPSQARHLLSQTLSHGRHLGEVIGPPDTMLPQFSPRFPRSTVRLTLPRRHLFPVSSLPALGPREAGGEERVAEQAAERWLLPVIRDGMGEAAVISDLGGEAREEAEITLGQREVS